MTSRQRYKNFYNAFKSVDLIDNANTTFGKSITEYEIYRRTDVSNLTNVRGYYLHVTQRLIVPNLNDYPLGSVASASFHDYPAIIHNKMAIKLNNNATARVAQVFPRTLNSSVNSNSSTSSSESKSLMHQSTAGSSSTNVNTFGVTASIGLFGDIPIEDLSLSYSHSWEHSNSNQSTAGGGSSSSSNDGRSTSMSVKDWSAYSQISENNKSVSWIWGQTYPWDVILYNQSLDGDNVNLPDFVADRLLSDGLILPPSELSLFGLDFTSNAGWIIDFPEGIQQSEAIAVSHETTCYTASHTLSGSKVVANLQSSGEASTAKFTTDPFDLSLYSISPIGGYAAEHPASIGFKADEFTYPPTKNTDQFKITSRTNDLQVIGSGFDSIMQSSFKTDPSLDVQFKIADNYLDYDLILVNWLEGDYDCVINWTINDKFSGSTRLTRVKSSEAQNSETKIPLRNRNFTSLNFHDHLVIGLNKVSLKISGIEQKASTEKCSYTLFSAAIA